MAGQVLAILAGLVGAGRTEVVRALFGADAYESGSMKGIANHMRALDLLQAVRLPDGRVVITQPRVPPRSNADSMILSLLKNPANGGSPMMAR